MSFCIGPYVGKRDAVIKAVKESVVAYTKNCTNPQLEEVSTFIVAELARCPEKQTCTVHAWGHSDPSGRWATIGVNQMLGPAMPGPHLVE